MDLPEGGDRVIRLGNREITVTLQREKVPSKSGRLWFSAGALARLNLQRGMKLNVVEENGVYRLGPVVAVMLGGEIRRKIKKARTMARLIALEEEARKEGCLLFFFHPKDVDWSWGMIKGYRYISQSKGWQAGKFPFPDVFYDRGVFTRREKALANSVRKKIMALDGLAMINSKHYYGKWEVYDCLRHKPSIRSHLPETRKYYHPLDLELMAEKYGSVFLKSSMGSRGKQVVQVQYKGPEKYFFRYDLPRRTMSFYNGPDFIALLPRSMGQGLLVVQQGINLARIKERCFDIRVLAQKDSRGQWGLTGAVARLANPGRVTTNLNSGGKALSLALVLVKVFPYTHQRIMKNLQSLVMDVCKTLESSFGNQGELGLDLGVDKKGHLWLIEVNGKPAKTTLMKVEKNADCKAFRRPLQYAKMLSGFNR
ncbi:MAG: YheC/YheD family endospore coat-associated protein [Thermincolia bacterium]